MSSCRREDTTIMNAAIVATISHTESAPTTNRKQQHVVSSNLKSATASATSSNNSNSNNNNNSNNNFNTNSNWNKLDYRKRKRMASCDDDSCSIPSPPPTRATRQQTTKQRCQLSPNFNIVAEKVNAINVVKKNISNQKKILRSTTVEHDKDISFDNVSGNHYSGDDDNDEKIAEDRVEDVVGVVNDNEEGGSKSDDEQKADSEPPKRQQQEKQVDEDPLKCVDSRNYNNKHVMLTAETCELPSSASDDHERNMDKNEQEEAEELKEGGDYNDNEDNNDNVGDGDNDVNADENMNENEEIDEVRSYVAVANRDDRVDERRQNRSIDGEYEEEGGNGADENDDDATKNYEKLTFIATAPLEHLSYTTTATMTTAKTKNEMLTQIATSTSNNDDVPINATKYEDDDDDADEACSKYNNNTAKHLPTAVVDIHNVAKTETTMATLRTIDDNIVNLEKKCTSDSDKINDACSNTHVRTTDITNTYDDNFGYQNGCESKFSSNSNIVTVKNNNNAYNDFYDDIRQRMNAAANASSYANANDGEPDGEGEGEGEVSGNSSSNISKNALYNTLETDFDRTEFLNNNNNSTATTPTTTNNMNNNNDSNNTDGCATKNKTIKFPNNMTTMEAEMEREMEAEALTQINNVERNITNNCESVSSRYHNLSEYDNHRTAEAEETEEAAAYVAEDAETLQQNKAALEWGQDNDDFKYNSDKDNLNYGDRHSNETHLGHNVTLSDEAAMLQQQEEGEILCFKTHHQQQQETIFNSSNNIAVNKQEAESQQHQHHINQFLSPIQTNEQLKNETTATNRENDNYHHMHQQQEHSKSGVNSYVQQELEQQYQHQQHQHQHEQHQHEQHQHGQHQHEQHQHEQHQDAYENLLQNLTVPEEKQNHQLKHQRQQQRATTLHHEMQHYTHEQLFHLQHPQQEQQQQTQTSLHPMSLHSHQMHSQLQLQHTIHQQQHNQHHRLSQRENEHSHLISYLHDSTVEQQQQHHNRLHQQQQQTRDIYHYHQQQQQQQQQQHEYQQQHLQQSVSLLIVSQRQQLLKHAAGVPTAMTSPSASKQCTNQLTTTTSTTIDDLMVDEFHEDPSMAYKLCLSPSNVKHENQDDGYETSAGDVLTPNSHSSSTHSLTPQHQMQHTAVGLIPPIKNDDQQLRLQQQQQQLGAVNTEVIDQQQRQQQHINDKINQETSSDTNTNILPNPYGFMDNEVAAANDNMRMMASPAAHKTGNNVSSNYSEPTETGAVTSSQVEEMFPMQRQQQQQQPIHNSTIPSGTDLASQHHLTQELTSGNNHIKMVCNAITDDGQQAFVDINDPSINMKALQKRRGRKKKIAAAEVNVAPNNPNAQLHYDAAEVAASGILLKSKERKKHDRFNGMPEEEVVKRTLPDHLCDNLDIVIIGINPGLFAAYKGHHYAGPGNHFWKCLYLSGLTQDQMSADEDYKLMKHGIGFTNMVQRATKGSADLTRKEIKEGSRVLLEKLQRFRPKIAVFNGKLIFEVFSGKKDFNFGRQPECVDGTDTYVWVMPSSSARCAQLPRAADKVPFYAALKKFRDYLNGSIPHIDDFECVFTEQKIKQCCEQQSLKLSLSDSRSLSTTTTEQSNILHNNGNRSRDTLKSNLPPPKLSDSSPTQNSSNILTQFPGEHNSSYIYGSDENHNTRNMGDNIPVPGPPPQTIMAAGTLSQHNSGCGDIYMMSASSFHGQQPPEKKKRGRPKKIKGQDILDPTIGNKILINNHNSQGAFGAGSNDFSNILNLSMIGSVGGEIPKKKRGRPKKIKAPLDMLQTQRAIPPLMHQKPNVLPTQTLTGDHIASPQRQQQPLYRTPPPSMNVQQRLYASSASPMRSPALNCSYATNTPPNTGSKSTPPIHQQQLSDKLGDSNGAMGSPADLRSSQQGTSSQMCGGDTSSSNYFTGKLISSASDIISNETVIGTAVDVTEDTETNDPHLGESPQPSSPNICAVDFEPPTAIATTNATNNTEHEHHGSEIEQHHRQMSLLHQRMRQQSLRYAYTPHDAASNEHTTRNTFQKWLSPQHSQHFNHTHQQQQQHHQTLHYQEQHMQRLQLQHNQEQQQQQSLHSQWHRHHQHRYEDAGNYLLSSPHHQHLNQQQQNVSGRDQQQAANLHTQLSSDVASKSLSGLESLVDQIPTILENESPAGAISSATAANAAAAAAVVSAAVESRLQCLQNTVSNASEMVQSEHYCGGAASGSTPSDLISDTNETVTGANSNSGSNTPHAANSLYGVNSPGNYSIHRLNSATASAASSPGIMSPHRHQQQLSLHQQQYGNSNTTTRLMIDMLPPSTSTNSPSESATAVAAVGQTATSCTAPTSTTEAASSNTSNSSNIYTNIHNSNFSVSNLAASSATSTSRSENSYATLTPPNTQNVYHHSNLMAAALFANSPTNLVTAETPTTATAAAAAHAHHITQHPQMYMDPHAHMPPHVPVNSMYPPPPHHHHHHSAHHHAVAYAVTQHSIPPSEYSNPYSTASASTAAVNQTAGVTAAAAHTLHMPSPNYPYGYGTQGNYTTAAAMHAVAAHQSTATPPPPGTVSAAAVAAAAAAAVVYHNHPHHGHHPHHLAMFDRLKPSDIGGYGGF